MSDISNWKTKWIDILSQEQELCFDVSAGMDSRALLTLVPELLKRGVDIYYYNNPLKFKERDPKIQVMKDRGELGVDGLGAVLAEMAGLKKHPGGHYIKRVRGFRNKFEKDYCPLYEFTKAQVYDIVKTLPEMYLKFPFKSRTETDIYTFDEISQELLEKLT